MAFLPAYGIIRLLRRATLRQLQKVVDQAKGKTVACPEGQVQRDIVEADIGIKTRAESGIAACRHRRIAQRATSRCQMSSRKSRPG